MAAEVAAQGAAAARGATVAQGRRTVQGRRRGGAGAALGLEAVALGCEKRRRMSPRVCALAHKYLIPIGQKRSRQE
jgi:hypothetical protein